MIPKLKPQKRNFYAFSYATNTDLSPTYTLIYIQEQGCTFFNAINPLVLHQHHQNIQMSSHNITLKQILAPGSVNVPLHIPDFPDIAYLTNISTA